MTKTRGCEALKEAREAVGLTQKELAELASVSTVLISQIEQGKRHLVGKTGARVWAEIDKAEDRRLKDAIASIGKRTREEREKNRPDYSQAHFNEPSKLSQWFATLGIGPEKLSQVSNVPVETIRAIHGGKEPFSEPARTMIWDAIFRLTDEKALRDAEVMVRENPPNPFGLLTPVFFDKTPEQRLQQIIDAQDKVIEDLKAREANKTEILRKRMDEQDALIKRLIEYNGLRSEAIGKTAEADDLAEQIQERLRKDSEQ
jgi:transcriptional regulator with XRE-family HTH domain